MNRMAGWVVVRCCLLGAFAGLPDRIVSTRGAAPPDGGAGFALPAMQSAVANEPTVVFWTGFDAAEGYDVAKPLRGQRSWQGEGSGGNGLVTDFFEGWGQQAFIGYAPPAPKDDFLSVWRPLQAPPPKPEQPVWKFSVWMQVVDSTNGEYDDFRWRAFNSDGQRLFALDFQNATLDINYLLDDEAGFRPTGFTFDPDVIYLLEIWMNFARNNWQAVLNGQVVVDAQPITTAGARLDLGDIDAFWALRTKGAPGDNYLLFDEYTVTIEPADHIPVTLELLGLNSRKEFELYVHAERDRRMALEATVNLVDWTPLATNRLSEGYWFFTDTSSAGSPLRFYRAREVLP
ncbi:MAG: hypothetical protein HS113_18050 [Verrucomicrobiales bacterium]|nr:hypothetical protein [Verrucomicrobiales bacterium]